MNISFVKLVRLDVNNILLKWPTPKEFEILGLKSIGYEKNIKLQWNTENISNTGIIGNPKHSSSAKGQKLVNIIILTIQKIIKELELL